MFTLNDLYDQIIYGSHLALSKNEFEMLMKLYVLPSFNRDYPHTKTILIKNKKRFYPLYDLTGYDATSFLTHAFVVRLTGFLANRIKATDLIPYDSEFIYIMASNELTKNLISMAYKNNSCVMSPVIM